MSICFIFVNSGLLGTILISGLSVIILFISVYDIAKSKRCTFPFSFSHGKAKYKDLLYLKNIAPQKEYCTQYCQIQEFVVSEQY